MTEQQKTFSVSSSIAVAPSSGVFFARFTIIAGGTHSAPEASEAIFGKCRVEGKSFAIIVTP